MQICIPQIRTLLTKTSKTKRYGRSVAHLQSKDHDVTDLQMRTDGDYRGDLWAAFWAPHALKMPPKRAIKVFASQRHDNYNKGTLGGQYAGPTHNSV